MAIKITFTNHKGGVAKTSSTLQMAGEFGRLGYKVLVLDLDSQVNCSIHLGLIHPSEANISMADLLNNNDNSLIRKSIHETRFKNVSLIYSSIELHSVEENLKDISMRHNEEIKRITKEIDDEFDIIFIDTPPSLRVLTTNALVSADYYIIPVESGSSYSLYGFNDVENLAQKIKNSLNEDLKFLGVLLVKHDKRLQVCQALEETIKQRKIKLIDITIPNSTKINQASMLKKTIHEIDKESSVCREIKRLAKFIEQETNLKKAS